MTQKKTRCCQSVKKELMGTKYLLKKTWFIIPNDQKILLSCINLGFLEWVPLIKAKKG